MEEKETNNEEKEMTMELAGRQLLDLAKQVGKLERENARLTAERDRLREALLEQANRMQNGCGNHRCKVRPPIGQATNGPCQCVGTTAGKRLRQIVTDTNSQPEKEEKL